MGGACSAQVQAQNEHMEDRPPPCTRPLPILISQRAEPYINGRRMPLVDTPEDDMHHKILTPEYERRFVDTQVFPPSTPFLLRGLAAALERGHPDWRPTVSQLADVLRPLDCRADVVAVGGAYGAALMIERDHPGPALLLYGSIVNTLFHEPDTSLIDAIGRVKALLRPHGLDADNDMIETLRAARERADMGRISRMMKREFARGLRLTGRYDDVTASHLAARIVDSTHMVRHGALVDRPVWKEIQPTDNGYFVDLRDAESIGSTDPFQEHPKPPAVWGGKSLFQELLGVANISVTALIIERLSQYRDATKGA
jgi:hypothetical protein